MCDFFALHIHHHQALAFFNKRQLLAVGRELRFAAIHGFVGSNDFLIDERGIGEIEVFFARDGGFHQLPLAIALGSIHQGAVVGTPSHVGFRLGGVGNFLGGGVVYRSNKHLASEH